MLRLVDPPSRDDWRVKGLCVMNYLPMKLHIQGQSSNISGIITHSNGVTHTDISAVGELELETEVNGLIGWEKEVLLKFFSQRNWIRVDCGVLEN